MTIKSSIVDINQIKKGIMVMCQQTHQGILLIVEFVRNQMIFLIDRTNKTYIEMRKGTFAYNVQDYSNTAVGKTLTVNTRI